MGDGATKTYQSSAARLFEAVLRTVASLNYSIQHTDRVVRTVSFNTGLSWRSFAGQDMTAIIIPDGDAGSSLTLSGRRAQRLWQKVDWGELGAIQKKFLKRLETILPSVPEPTPQPPQVVAGSGQTVEA